jgi:hypothetical protein
VKTYPSSFFYRARGPRARGEDRKKKGGGIGYERRREGPFFELRSRRFAVVGGGREKILPFGENFLLNKKELLL